MNQWRKILSEIVTTEIFCKYCNSVVESITSPEFCNIDHQIRWTIRDELKNIGNSES